MLPEYEVLSKEHQLFVSKFLKNQMVNREAGRERVLRMEAARRRRRRWVRSVIFEVLPAKLASLVAPPCIEC